MSLPLAERPEGLLDLATPSPFQEYAASARKRPASGATRLAVENLTAEADPRFRVQCLCDVYRKLEPREIRDHLKTAARLAVGNESSSVSSRIRASPATPASFPRS